MAYRFTKASAISAVLAANIALQKEFTDVGDPYDRLAMNMNSTNTAGRIEVAEAAYLYGSRAMRGSRAFDNCFENGDGDKVVAELVRRAAENPALERAIANDFSGVFPPSWIETAMRNLPVRACSIVCREHPEWGSWGVMEDRGDYYEIHASGGQGGRVLDKAEAVEHWALAG